MQILKNVALFQINNNPVEYMLINGSVNHPNCSNIYKELRVVIPKIYTRMQKKDGEKIEKNL